MLAPEEQKPATSHIHVACFALLALIYIEHLQYFDNIFDGDGSVLLINLLASRVAGHILRLALATKPPGKVQGCRADGTSTLIGIGLARNPPAKLLTTQDVHLVPIFATLREVRARSERSWYRCSGR